MVTLEQIKLLESRVTRALDIVKNVTGENRYLKGKLESYQKKIDELEVLIQRFREEQTRIEEGILSALERLGRFEEAVETAPVSGVASPATGSTVTGSTVTGSTAPSQDWAAPDQAVETIVLPVSQPAVKPQEPPAALYIPAEEDGEDTLIFGESLEDDDPSGDSADDDGPEVSSAELDIF